MSIGFQQTLVPLLLVPIGAMIVVGPLALIGPYASAVLIYLITALACYGIEKLFVVPRASVVATPATTASLGWRTLGSVGRLVRCSAVRRYVASAKARAMGRSSSLSSYYMDSLRELA
jgi:hypothetical protein